MAGQDSTKTNFFKTQELKQNYKLLVELQFKRIESETQGEQLLIKDEIIKRKDQQIKLNKQINENLKTQIKLIKPKWYDKFIIGAGVGILFTTTIVLLLN